MVAIGANPVQRPRVPAGLRSAVAAALESKKFEAPVVASIAGRGVNEAADSRVHHLEWREWTHDVHYDFVVPARFAPRTAPFAGFARHFHPIATPIVALVVGLLRSLRACWTRPPSNSRSCVLVSLGKF